MTDSMISMRVDADTEQRIDASAGAHKINRSDWIRQAVQTALDSEALAAKQAPSLVEIARNLESLQQTLDHVETTNSESNQAIDDLSRTIVIERAADRFMTEQVLRSAVRAAYVAIQIAVEGRFREGDGCVTQLCEEADDAFKEGLAFIEQGMDRARSDMEQTLKRGLQA